MQSDIQWRKWKYDETVYHVDDDDDDNDHDARGKHNHSNQRWEFAFSLNQTVENETEMDHEHTRKPFSPFDVLFFHTVFRIGHVWSFFSLIVRQDVLSCAMNELVNVEHEK